MDQHTLDVTHFPTAINARQRGFSLIEIALVLVIVGLALGGIVAALGPQLENKKINDTQRALEEAKEALLGYAVINKRLPGPATGASNGVAVACATEVLCTGLIPWGTLGVAKLDAWGKVIRYSVTPIYVNSDITASTDSATKVVNTRTAGALVADPPNVPALIFSHGNANFGTTDAGGTVPNSAAPNNLDEITNNTGGVGATAGTTFVRRSPTLAGATGGEFDDLVITIPNTILIARMSKAGAF